MAEAVQDRAMPDPIVEVQDLTFSYPGAASPALAGISLRIERGERCLLCGANGAGKTTLLRMIAGKHLCDERAVRVLGRPAFHDTSLANELSFIGGSFPFAVDVRVAEVLAGTRGEPARRERLLRMLEVDPEWRMHRISEGQRRRVQLLLGLLLPYRVLLLDEVTTDLDLLGRADLLGFLREESEGRGAAILYATHIFERLEGWATHLALLERGRLRRKDPLASLPELAALRARGSLAPLSELVEGWLRSGR
jgi:CCR4-NOT complex subunit CAF16